MAIKHVSSRGFDSGLFCLTRKLPQYNFERVYMVCVDAGDHLQGADGAEGSALPAHPAGDNPGGRNSPELPRRLQWRKHGQHWAQQQPRGVKPDGDLVRLWESVNPQIHVFLSCED